MRSQAILLSAVALGSALGGIARFALSQWVDRWAHGPFPFSTLAVNAIGSFLIGIVAAFALAENASLSPTLRLFLMTGFFGGFTTFSTFSLQTLQLLHNGHIVHALANSIGSLCLCLIAVAIGHWLTTRGLLLAH